MVTLRETTDILISLLKKYNTVAEVLTLFKTMFKENKDDGIALMTFHKSKGLECRDVYLIRLDLWPSKFAETKEQLLQENNIMFVGRTRAMRGINYC